MMLVFHPCDVFTDRRFAGNPLTIVLGTGDFDCTITQAEEAGLVPERVWRGGGETRVEFVVSALPHAVVGATVAPQVRIAGSAVPVSQGRIKAAPQD